MISGVISPVWIIHQHWWGICEKLQIIGSESILSWIIGNLPIGIIKTIIQIMIEWVPFHTSPKQILQLIALLYYVSFRILLIYPACSSSNETFVYPLQNKNFIIVIFIHCPIHKLSGFWHSTTISSLNIFLKALILPIMISSRKKTDH